MTISMHDGDYSLYLLHAAFWIDFAVTRAIVSAKAPAVRDSAGARTAVSDPHSRLIIVPHMIAFALMYWGIGASVFAHRGPQWLPGQHILGAAIVVAGAALATWALVYFRSWRFRATLDAGHELATGGPFRLLRHPIYMALNLLAIGTAVWSPTPSLLAAAAIMMIGSDIRGRAEERLLLSAFGDAYRTYAARTARFFPGVY